MDNPLHPRSGAHPPTPMRKRSINPWSWQDQRSYHQAIEVTQPAGTLYVSGQTAIDAAGRSSDADMRSQLIQALANLEQVIEAAGYTPANIVRLNVYTLSAEEFMDCFDVFEAWAGRWRIAQASTVLEVKGLFEKLNVELEATVVR
ncbi:RidA family protein [Lewinella sp. IMCC34183]|uniref:RidA family protein n=1 Tax=Lewinella sp. IMCC34183 TaxID=2248762 RepID=UPI0018E51794|nr:RidA family protein [Lewinella sp. IMCC34183]